MLGSMNQHDARYPATLWLSVAAALAGSFTCGKASTPAILPGQAAAWVAFRGLRRRQQFIIWCDNLLRRLPDRGAEHASLSYQGQLAVYA